MGNIQWSPPVDGCRKEEINTPPLESGWRRWVLPAAPTCPDFVSSFRGLVFCTWLRPQVAANNLGLFYWGVIWPGPFEQQCPGEVLDIIYLRMNFFFFFNNNILSEISNYFVTAWLNMVIKVIKRLFFPKLKKRGGGMWGLERKGREWESQIPW